MKKTFAITLFLICLFPGFATADEEKNKNGFNYVFEIGYQETVEYDSAAARYYIPSLNADSAYQFSDSASFDLKVSEINGKSDMEKLDFARYVYKELGRRYDYDVASFKVPRETKAPDDVINLIASYPGSQFGLQGSGVVCSQASTFTKWLLEEKFNIPAQSVSVSASVPHNVTVAWVNGRHYILDWQNIHDTGESKLDRAIQVYERMNGISLTRIFNSDSVMEGYIRTKAYDTLYEETTGYRSMTERHLGLGLSPPGHKKELLVRADPLNHEIKLTWNGLRLGISHKNYDDSANSISETINFLAGVTFSPTQRNRVGVDYAHSLLWNKFADNPTEKRSYTSFKGSIYHNYSYPYRFKDSDASIFFTLTNEVYASGYSKGKQNAMGFSDAEYETHYGLGYMYQGDSATCRLEAGKGLTPGGNKDNGSFEILNDITYYQASFSWKSDFATISGSGYYADFFNMWAEVKEELSVQTRFGGFFAQRRYKLDHSQYDNLVDENKWMTLSYVTPVWMGSRLKFRYEDLGGADEAGYSAYLMFGF